MEKVRVTEILSAYPEDDEKFHKLVFKQDSNGDCHIAVVPEGERAVNYPVVTICGPNGGGPGKMIPGLAKKLLEFIELIRKHPHVLGVKVE